MEFFRSVCLLLLLSLAVSVGAQPGYPGISVNTNFNPLTAQPLDGRDTIATLADTTILNAGFIYNGLITYAYDVEQRWWYHQNKWQEYGTGADGYIADDLAAGTVTYDVVGDFNLDFSGQGNFDLDSLAYFFVTPRANQGGNDGYIYLGRPGEHNVQIYYDGLGTGFTRIGNDNLYWLFQQTNGRLDISATSTGFEILDGRSPASAAGLQYNASYTYGFTGLSLVHKDYVDSAAVAADTYLGNADQYIIGNRLVSGSDLYDLTFDSLTQVDIHAGELFFTDGPTSLINILGTTTRWNTDNAGFIRFNDLGTSGLYMQEISNDSIFRVYTTQGAAGIQALDREAGGMTYYAGDISVKPNEVWARVYDPSNVTDAEIRVGLGRVEINGTDSTILQLDVFNEALTTVVAIDTTGGRNRLYLKTQEGGTMSFDDYSVGAATAAVARYGGTATTITNPGVGAYDFDVKAGAYVNNIDFLGNNTTTNAGTLTLTIDNSANGRDRFFSVQILQRSSNGLVDEFATGTNYTSQSAAGNVTTITINNLNGFSTAGYRIMLR